MSEINTGGSAFPETTIAGPRPMKSLNQGMTLRDYFAARALQVFLNNPETDWDEDVRDAYAVADKMIKERDKA